MVFRSCAEFHDAVLHNQEISRNILRLVGIRLWPIGNLSGRNEPEFWKEVDSRWKEWLGCVPPFDSASWRRLALQLGLTPPDEIDEAWLREHVVASLEAKYRGPVETPAKAKAAPTEAEEKVSVNAALKIVRAEKGGGLVGKEIVKRLAGEGIKIVESTFRKSVAPRLKKHGIKNEPSRGGYYDSRQVNEE